MEDSGKRAKYDVATHYAFGLNWADYARSVDEDRIRIAAEELRQLTGALDDKTFLDIGCGSGLHALAALRMGARHVTAMDLDPVSVDTADRVIREHWHRANYSCRIGNVFVDLGDAKFDVVYSWGVLHHTGAMWEAIAHAARAVQPEGKLVIALYRATPLCGAWRVEKRLYRKLPRLLQLPFDGAYALACVCGYALSGRDPVRVVREYSQRRGMSWWSDIRDWLGGYPYESARPADVQACMASLSFELETIRKERPSRWLVRTGLLGSGCVEYVFRRRAPVPA